MNIQDAVSQAVNLTHHADLLRFFVQVLLVCTDRVGP
jgi:hypothetical protein